MRKRFVKNNKLVAPEEMMAIMGELYMQGEMEFSAFARLFDPGDLYHKNMSDEEIDEARENSYVNKLFKIFRREFFNGHDFNVWVGGIPMNEEDENFYLNPTS